MFKGFIFDLDGCITDTAEMHYQAWKVLCKQQGWEFSREVNEDLRGRSRDACIRLIAPSGLTEGEYDELAMFKNDIYVESLSNLTKNDILEGVEEFLIYLKERKILISVASASKNARFIIDKLGIAHYFTAISDGYSVVHSKPAPDVFLHSCGQLGLLVKDCVVVEDAEAGILGAKSAGFSTIAIGEHLVDCEPTFLVKSTVGLQALMVN